MPKITLVPDGDGGGSNNGGAAGWGSSAGGTAAAALAEPGGNYVSSAYDFPPFSSFDASAARDVTLSTGAVPAGRLLLVRMTADVATDLVLPDGSVSYGFGIALTKGIGGPVILSIGEDDVQALNGVVSVFVPVTLTQAEVDALRVTLSNRFSSTGTSGPSSYETRIYSLSVEIEWTDQRVRMIV